MEKFLIALCDDDEYVHEEIDSIINNAEELNNYDIEILHYYDGDSLLKSDVKSDIVLMDIEMPGLDGIDVSAKLNIKYNDDNNIIMLTGIRERFKEAFKIGALRFVTKPIEREELLEAVISTIDKISKGKLINIVYNNINYEIGQKEIYMIESSGSYVTLYTKDKSFEIRRSLISFERELDSRMFFLTHRSYLVNVSHIKKIDGESCILNNGMRALVSVRNQTQILQKIFDYEMNI